MANYPRIMSSGIISTSATWLNTAGAWTSTEAHTIFPPRTECALCESKIPADRQESRLSYCSDECERAAAVAEKLAGPEAQRIDYGASFHLNSTVLHSSGLVTFSARYVSTSWSMSSLSTHITGSFPVTLGQP